MPAERRVLNDAEKTQVRAHFPECYLCGESFEGYLPEEIQYDHIYAFADGYTQDPVNFAPVHASKSKKNCHKLKGRKSPYQFKEELRIREDMKNVTGLKDVCVQADPLDVVMDQKNNTIRVNGRTLPLFNQRLNDEDHFYFFDEIETRYIENDEKIQLRPLEDKIFGMIFHLRSHMQLLPSLGRLDIKEKKIKVFDGQHKAVAQIIGNKRKRVPCIVFVDPDVEKLRITVFAAHNEFLQQRYKKSHIGDKLADMFADRIKAFQETTGNPQSPYTEKDILRHDAAAPRRKFLLSAIIKELKNVEVGDFVERYVAQDKKAQKQKPMIWESLELFVKAFCNLEPVEVKSDDANNFRSDEVDNLMFLLECVEDHAISGKWNPALPDSESHKLSRKYFYDKALTVWLKRLAFALKFAFDQKMGKAFPGPLCYRPAFSSEVRERFDGIFERLVTHGLWLNTANEPIISGNSEKHIEELFNVQGLDWVYLTKLE